MALLEKVYDPLVWALSAGRVGSLQRATLTAGGVGPGADVLDVGCGTGGLVVAARQAAGPGARVVGLDASAAMRAKARRRGIRSGVEVELIEGRVECLPFPDGCFDVVSLSLVLHYLAADQAAQAIGEARRVLRTGGRVVVVDFGRSRGVRSRLRAHLMLHGAVAASAPDLGTLLSGAGLAEVSSWPSPLPALQIVAGTRREP